jgi:hypothetical protein
MKKNISGIIFILLLLSQTASAVIRNVPGNYATITLAINASGNGDTVLVEPGTYFENLNFRGRKIVLTSRFYINNDLSYINNTIINGSTPLQPDTASVVLFNSGEDTTTVLQGFTITGGSGTKWTDEHAAGVYREGGGILIALSSPIIRFNKIINNSAVNTSGVASAGGGGLRIGDGYPRVLNNIILNNRGIYGAGIVLNYTGCIVKNNIICGNTGSQQYYSGAGIWANSNRSGTSKIIENNTIINNSGSTGTGGVLAYGSTLTLRNNILWGNAPSQLQAVGGGTINISYCDVQGGYTGTGNISSYPIFADTNYILANNSPCIDAGDSTSIYNDPVDSAHTGFAKFPSKGTLRNDIGAYGGQNSNLLSGTSVIGIRYTDITVPDGYNLIGNFPNPFNPSTTIKFSVPKQSIVSLNIYDVTGRLIENLFSSEISGGNYEIMWDASCFSSGLYFVRMESGSYNKAIRMTLLK